MIDVTVTRPNWVVFGARKDVCSHHDKTTLRIAHPSSRSKGGQHGKASVGDVSKLGHRAFDLGMGQSVPFHDVGLLVDEVTAERNQIVGVHLAISVHDRNDVIGAQVPLEVLKAHRNSGTHTQPSTLQDHHLKGQIKAFDRLDRSIRGAIIDHHDQIHFRRQGA